MKKILIIILLAAAGMMAYNTNPDKEDHIIAIDTGMMDIIDEEVDTAFREIAKIIIPTIVEKDVYPRLEYSNYWILSMVKLHHTDGKTYPLSVGACGYVHFFKQQVAKAVRKNIKGDVVKDDADKEKMREFIRNVIP